MTINDSCFVKLIFKTFFFSCKILHINMSMASVHDLIKYDPSENIGLSMEIDQYRLFAGIVKTRSNSNKLSKG